MPDFHAHASAMIDTAPERVYQILADYRVEHPSVLPTPFTDLTVLEGGVGAGTVFTVGMIVFGKERRIQGTVSEPEPGRILAETYENGGIGITTFTVEPQAAGTHLTIATRGRTNYAGFLGRIEEILTVWFLHSIYRKEIELIEDRAKVSQLP